MAAQVQELYYAPFGGWSLAVVLLVLVLVSRFVVYPNLLSPLARIPSAHWSSSISPLWILCIRFRHRENKVLLAAHRRLGPIIRVAPNELSINDMDCVRTVYGGGFDKTDWYAVFDNYGVPCMFSTRPTREHSVRKRMISNVYSKSFIHSSESSKAQARILLFDRILPLLQHSASESQAPHGVNVHSIFLAATMDFISAYVFGIRHSTNFVQNAAYREHWLELYMSRHDYPFFPQELPRLTRFLRKLGIPPYPRWVDAANRELGEWNRRICKAALESRAPSSGGVARPEDDPVVLEALLAGLSKEEATNGKESPLYHTGIRQRELSVSSELFDHVLAGQETAGVTLTYMTWRLSRDQELQRALQAELLTLEPGLKAGGQGHIPDTKLLDALPTLHAVVMETLRLHAPLPGPLPRQTPYPFSQLGPFRVPGGVRVAALAYTLHRQERVYPDADKFDHTRWLREGIDDGAHRKEAARNFWAFSSGGKMCVGSHFAMNEMKLIVAAIYSNFTTYVVEDGGMEQTDGYTSRPVGERLYLRFEPTN